MLEITLPMSNVRSRDAVGAVAEPEGGPTCVDAP